MTGFLRQADVCRRLGISYQTWWRWQKDGTAPEPAKLPGAKKWRVDVIEAFAQGEVKPAGKRYFGAAHRAATR